jgi:hypothetical protein
LGGDVFFFVILLLFAELPVGILTTCSRTMNVQEEGPPGLGLSPDSIPSLASCFDRLGQRAHLHRIERQC